MVGGWYVDGGASIGYFDVFFSVQLDQYKLQGR